MGKATGIITKVEDNPVRSMYIATVAEKPYGILSPESADEAKKLMDERVNVEIEFDNVRDRGNVIRVLRKIER